MYAQYYKCNQKDQPPKMKMCVMISGNGSNLQALIDAGIHIDLVVSNKPNAYGLVRATNHNIPTLVVVFDKTTQTRLQYDTLLTTIILEKCVPDLIVLAGFMHVLVNNKQYLVNIINDRMVDL